MAINGARAIKAMVTETSDLDANKGIAYRHLSLYDAGIELVRVVCLFFFKCGGGGSRLGIGCLDLVGLVVFWEDSLSVFWWGGLG